jgi:outer membrane protein, heavy metal efflux system
MKSSYALTITSLLFLSPLSVTRGQEAPPASQPVKLADLLAEAERSNPQIQAARHGWDSAKQVPTQVSTLPDPQFVLQQVNVG